jgi:hypothetical protein
VHDQRHDGLLGGVPVLAAMKAAVAAPPRAGPVASAPMAAGRPKPMVPRPPEVKNERQESTGK